MRPDIGPEEVDVGLQFAGLVLTLQGQLVEELHTTFLGLFEVFAPDDGKREVRVEFRGDFVRLVRGHVPCASSSQGWLGQPKASIRPTHGVKRLSGSSATRRYSMPHAFKGDVFLRMAEGFAEADADLLGDDVDVALSLDLGNAGGDAVFHLNAGVHFHKEGAAVLGDDPFPRAHVVVTDLAGQREGVAGDVFQQLVRVEIVFDGRGVETGRDFDTLLEAGGLDRAVAGAEVDRVFAAPVGRRSALQGG